MSSVKSFEVLCPNGRRQKVKANNTSTLLQVLEECCLKQGFNSDEFDLRHQRTIVDAGSMVRYANLPNNAKLEMVKRTNPRKAAQITVALQLKSGKRLEDAFSPSTSLYDILKYWESKSESSLLVQHPVCIYMSNEISGEKALQTTSLQDLGLLSGTAVIRLIHKEPPPDVVNILANSEMQEIDDRMMNERVGPSQSQLATRDLDINFATENQEIQFRQQESTTSNEGSCRDVKEQLTSSEHTDISDNRIACVVKEPEGKKPKLEESEDPVKIPIATSPFADFKFPEKTSKQHDIDIDPIDPIKLRKEVKLSLPCDRQPLVFVISESKDPDNDDKEKASIQTDDFYDVTVEDLRLMLRDLKAERILMENAPLRTSAMREDRDMQKIQEHDTVVIRVYFPEGLALQGCFRPLETVSAITDFVTENLEDRFLGNFYLYTTPPKTILKDQDLTLFKANLFPSAVVFFGSNLNEGNHLKQHLLENHVSRRDAELAAYQVLKRMKDKEDDLFKSPAPRAASSSQQDSPSENTKSSLPVRPRNPSSSTSDSVKPKVPKWLKLSK